MIISTQAVEEFGERVVRHVRDDAIRSCGLPLRPGYQGVDGERWRAAAAAAGDHALAKMMIPECVDSTVSGLLYAMDDANLLHLLFTTKRGETVDWSVVAWGEPVGWYGGYPGWRSWYSKERLVDYDDLADFHPFGGEDSRGDPAPVLEELPMPRRAIEELGELLVRHVRDVAIPSCDAQLTPQSDTPVARRWRAAALASGGAVPAHMLIPDCADETILAFLRAIDLGLFPLSFTAQSGETVSLREAGGGKLAEQYVGKDGWRAKYTKERFVNEVVDRAPE